MIDHTGATVSDFERSKQFYTTVLASIGYELIVHFPASKTGRTDVAGFGENGKPDFWIYQGTPNQPPVHVAFRVSSQQLVRLFHQTALDAGARDNGPPGPRSHYHEGYYGGFVLDPDGHNIEAVFHAG
ncbi:VOC family protein [Luteibacter sp. 22Crub2.1]|uniref:VOC family protein n=1 Tax=Luteibacter sp. 22Crub2.1 TaxID=1283288 RepID=UPI0009A6DB46|nr:VOC family protein [Luteibacter sp. 22Crub2.1]SKB77368.1 Catechol 2,3-dioxygenase [Luteibacter sp. 22Crub2.1]